MLKKGLGNGHRDGRCWLRRGLGCRHSRLPHPDPVAMPKRKRWLLFQAHDTCSGWTTKENDANWGAAVMKSGEVWNAIAHHVQQEEIPLWLISLPVSSRGSSSCSEEPLTAERPWRRVSMRGLFAEKKKRKARSTKNTQIGLKIQSTLWCLASFVCLRT